MIVSRIIKMVKKANGTEIEKIGPTGTFISTNVEMTPEESIESYSKRFRIEHCFVSRCNGLLFRDLKEKCELGKQQVRNLERNLACFQIPAMNDAAAELWI